MRTKLITDLPAKEAAKQILDELLFYAKHNMTKSPEQVAQIIADYSDNGDRIIEISILVWPKLRAIICKK